MKALLPSSALCSYSAFSRALGLGHFSGHWVSWGISAPLDSPSTLCCSSILTSSLPNRDTGREQRGSPDMKPPKEKCKCGSTPCPAFPDPLILLPTVRMQMCGQSGWQACFSDLQETNNSGNEGNLLSFKFLCHTFFCFSSGFCYP